ncbi:MAG TPA: hydroxymethylbilane synthase [Geminicoccaceae bacterium]|nr:hydroxymethylbilane synthase [Geminicoccus sp.]HMU50093.1 hydroxymethylbilane synthase [Geminicoccaceae bacterium]
MASTARLVIGTRGSPLALAQARLVEQALARAVPELAGPGAIATQVIRTSGDAVQDRPLAEIGGKGLFTKEIEDALLDGRIDIAVHSCKDMPTVLPQGLVLAASLPRADARDALICEGASTIEELQPAARLGSASVRRVAQALAVRPDLRAVPLRGSVGTRLRKLEEGQVQATFLAMAGLDRLGVADDRRVHPLPVETMLPAVAQGAIAIEARQADEGVFMLLSRIDDAATSRCVAAERALLAELDGSCRTPIAGLCIEEGQGLWLRGLAASPDGSRIARVELRGAAADARAMGLEAGRALRRSDAFG